MSIAILFDAEYPRIAVAEEVVKMVVGGLRVVVGK